MEKELIVKLKSEICSKVMRSGYHSDLIPPLDLRLDVEDLLEDLKELRFLQDVTFIGGEPENLQMNG